MPLLLSLFPYRKTALLACALFASGVVTSLVAPSAHAQIVYDNGGPDNVYAYSSDPQAGRYEADTFTFTAPTTFDTVQWWGVYYVDGVPVGDNFTLSLYNTTAGVPDSTAFQSFTVGSNVGRVATGNTLSEFPGVGVYQYTTTFTAPVSLGPGTYGLEIVNDAAGNNPNKYWAWATANQSGTSYYYRNSSTGPYTSIADLAFNLQNNVTTGAIPEPSEYAMVGMLGATLLFGMVKARKKKATQSA